MDAAYIRNFAIIAHIDHGKSTLADRLLELTGSLAMREMQEQVLDSMDLERERGITIKAHAVRMVYPAQDGKTYQLNLIDTPGHVDFSYEVSRSLASCEGALLVVDASQGVEAQTLANCYLAINHGLEIIPVINKIDLPSADVARAKEMIEGAVGPGRLRRVPDQRQNRAGCARCSGGDRQAHSAAEGHHRTRHLQALIFDSWFDPYRGVIVLARVFEGTLKKGQKIRFWWNGRVLQVENLGVLTPKPVEVEELVAGEVGFLIANIKNVADTKIGDTITDDDRPAIEPLPGFEEIKPMVFAGLTRSTRTSTRSCARRWKSFASTTRHFSSSPKVRSRWASASAADFSACCTWKSSRSGWSANTTSTSSPPRRACATRSR